MSQPGLAKPRRSRDEHGARHRFFDRGVHRCLQGEELLVPSHERRGLSEELAGLLVVREQQLPLEDDAALRPFHGEARVEEASAHSIEEDARAGSDARWTTYELDGP